MKSQRGSILAIVIIFIFIFTLLGMFAMRLVILQNESSDSELYYTRAHFAAIYGSDLALYHIMQWESIATSGTVNSEGRKFLVDNTYCLGYNENKWYPLKKIQEDGSIETFTDSISGGTGSGIRLKCYVEEETTLNPNDGFIPNLSTSSVDQKFGTYKYYVIRTSATMYSNYDAQEGEIAAAQDELHFFIAYSSGPAGAANDNNNITEFDPVTGSVTGTVIRIKNRTEFTGHADPPEYIISPSTPSFLTGKVQPVFRYYIRGRR